MMSTITASLIMLVLSSIGAIAKTKDFNDSVALEEDAYNRPIDFYYFVQRWPATYCHWRGTSRDYCCYPETENGVPGFSIHGLWPTYNDGNWPQYCCSSRQLARSHNCRDRKFSFSQIRSLEYQLKRFWASIKYRGPPRCSTKEGLQFWKYEWDKHGTCSTLYLKPYFHTTLSLRKHIDLLGALEAAGIQPDGKEHSLNNIKEAIRLRTGYLPGVSCNINHERKSQLFEVFVCVDNTYKVIQCPNSPPNPDRICDSRVVFPRLGL